MLFSGVIANGAGGTLGLNINVASQSGAPTFVNLAAVNTFTGDITATVKGTQSNNWLVIGGEKWSDGSNNTPIYGQEGSGSLGSGNYGGDIKFGNSGNLSLSYYSSANQTLSGNIGGASANNGSLIMEGSGTLTLSGTNTYTGTTTVNAGTLVINGDQSGATGTVTVNSGGTLGGSGTLGGDLVVNDGGTHAPGNSPGLQTINGATTYNSGSIFEWDLAANLDGSSLTQTWDHDNDNGTAEIAARGSAYDAVKINGSLTVADGAIFRVIQNTGVDFSTAFWTQNQTWSNIFDVTGSVTGWAVDTAVAVYNLSNTNITGSIAQYGSFTISGATLSWQAVPEPTSALAGLLLTAGLLRRRRK
jgi:fibronectin-binding autotransporter adhesin